MKTLTKPKLDDGTMNQWPPLAHITKDLPVRKGSVALCGTKLMGVGVPDANKMCMKCIKIARRGG